MQKVLITELVHPIVAEMLTHAGFDCTSVKKISTNDLFAQIDNYHGLVVRSKTYIDKGLIDQAKNLQFIGRTGSGMENINVAYAESKGIKCWNSPEGNCHSVGEQAVGILLSLLHNITKSDKELRQRFWNRIPNRGNELGGKIVGIVGFGHTGSAFAKRLQGFDVEILAYDKYKKNFGNESVKEASLANLYEKADILSLHLPLNEETAYWMDGQRLAQFQKPIYLLNTSRGGVLNTKEILQGFAQEQLNGLGLDVFENEDFKSFTNENWEWFEGLVSKQNVVITPHTAGVTTQSFYKMGAILANKIIVGMVKDKAYYVK